MTITWLGHATVLIALDGVRLITDPLLRNRVGPLVRTVAPPAAEALEKLDVILLSHLHADHTDIPSLRRIGQDTVVVAPTPAGEWLRRRGLPRVDELGPGESLSIGRVDVTATRVTHDHRRWPLGPVAEPIGFVIRGSRSVYFAGDTDLDPSMADLRGSVDVALIPISGWGPSVGPGHLDPRRAVLALALIAPAVAIPIHWGTIALPWSLGRRSDPARPAVDFAALARRHTPGIDVQVLSPGETIEL